MAHDAKKKIVLDILKPYAVGDVSDIAATIIRIDRWAKGDTAITHIKRKLEREAGRGRLSIKWIQDCFLLALRIESAITAYEKLDLERKEASDIDNERED